MSTITLTFNLQALDGGQSTRGIVGVLYNDGDRTYNLIERLTTGSSTAGYFKEVAWTGSNDSEYQQAANFAAAFNRDYRNALGTGNLGAKVTTGTNDVVITAQEGTFVGASYSGDVLVFSHEEPNNEDPIPSFATQVSYNLTGDCTTVDWDAVAADGVPPYKITYNGATVVENWDGSNQLIPVARGAVAKVILSDAAGQSSEYTRLVPRTLAPGEYKERITNYEQSSDIIIEEVNPIAFTGPIQYSLDEQDAETGTNYSESNAFPGVFPGTYRLFIKDVYNCEVSKLITVVSSTQDNSNQDLRVFEMSHANCVPFTELYDHREPNTKLNFYNSFDKYAARTVVNKYSTRILEEDVFTIQFKSSFQYHNVTMYGCDGSQKSVPVVLIKKNLGTDEKVDCSVINLGDGKYGIYFDGGNEYAPNTDTIIGDSKYVQYTPSWGKIGQTVSLSGFGTFKISDTGFDSDLDRGYLVLENLIASAEPQTQVQVRYNVQNYNLFEMFLRYSDMSAHITKVVIEKGDGFDAIYGRPWVSSDIIKSSNYDDLLNISYASTKNVAGLVFQSGYLGLVRIEGRLTPVFTGETKGFDGDENYFPLLDTLFLRHELTTEYITAKVAYMLAIITTLDGFTINGLKCRRSGFPEITPLGDSNMYTFKCELAETGNTLSGEDDEIVLNPSTGLESGGSTTGKSQTLPQFDGKTRLRTSGFVTVDGDYIEIN